MPKMRTLRKIAAIFFSIFVQCGFVVVTKALVASGRMSIFRDQSRESLLILLICIVGSSLIIERSRSDRFWKSYLFSVFSAVLPVNLYFAVQAIRLGTEGYWGLGLLSLNVLLALASIAALPIVGLFYWARGRKLTAISHRA